MTERDWVKHKGSNKIVLTAVYVKTRHMFDTRVQRCKPQYRRKMQKDITNTIQDSTSFSWKTIGKIGVAGERCKPIPMEGSSKRGEDEKRLCKCSKQ